MNQSQSSNFDPCRYEIASILLKALGDDSKAFKESDVVSFLERPRESKLGDWALPCFRFAKLLKKNPKDIATTLSKAIAKSKSKWIEKAQPVGPFLNIFVNKTLLAETLLPVLINGKYFKTFENHPDNSKTNVMIEYCSPNTHKEFHVGHVRNVSIGASVVKLFGYLGYPVVTANYPGDEGTHVGKCLWYYKKKNLTPPSKNKDAWFGEVYTKASQAHAQADGSEKETIDKEISEVVRQLEAEDGSYYDLWKSTRQQSLDGHNEIYEWLDAKFDRVFFESEFSEESQRIVDEYLKKGVFIESDGAIGLDLNKYKLGFLILRKSDGNTVYAAKDLALARKKFDEFNIDRSVYIVASEQNLHFKQVFKTLELMGFEKAKKCYHLNYGMVTLPEGKMSSRAGTVVTVSELRKNVEAELDIILKKYEGDWPKDEIEDTKNKLCVGAIKYGMLNTDAVKDVVFNIKEWVSFEGNSGPYLMYCYARTQSILRKAGEAGHKASMKKLEVLKESEEHEVLRYLYDFNDVVSQSGEGYKPSVLTHYLFDMCKSFNRFYIKLPVLKAENDDLRNARLSLAAGFAATLHKGLELLGIAPPERM